MGSDGFTFHYVSGPETIAIGATLPAIGIIIVLLRFLNRSNQGVPIGADDWLILGGLICVIGMGACLIDGAARKAMGYPTPPPPPSISTQEEMEEYNPPTTEFIGKLQFAFQLLLVVAYGFIKISIVYFYRRIFVPMGKRTTFSIVTHVLNVVLFLWTITFILLIIFPCKRHVDGSWGPPDQQALWCSQIGYTSEEGLTGSDLILDVVLLVLPLPLIWKLNMSTLRKVQVSGILILGLSAVAASITRLVLYVQVTQAAINGTVIDPNQALTLTMWWSMLEAGLALIAACLPSLSNFFTRFSLDATFKSLRKSFSLQSLRGSRSQSASRSRTTRDEIPDVEKHPSMSTQSSQTYSGAPGRAQ